MIAALNRMNYGTFWSMFCTRGIYELRDVRADGEKIGRRRGGGALVHRAEEPVKGESDGVRALEVDQHDPRSNLETIWEK